MHLLVFSDAVGRRQRLFLSQVLSSTGFRSLDANRNEVVPLNEETSNMKERRVSYYSPSPIMNDPINQAMEVPVAEDDYQLIFFCCPMHQTDFDKLMTKFKGEILGLLRLSLGTR